MSFKGIMRISSMQTRTPRPEFASTFRSPRPLSLRVSHRRSVRVAGPMIAADLRNRRPKPHTPPSTMPSTSNADTSRSRYGYVTTPAKRMPGAIGPNLSGQGRAEVSLGSTENRISGSNPSFSRKSARAAALTPGIFLDGEESRGFAKSVHDALAQWNEEPDRIFPKVMPCRLAEP